jgi:hypothetical protein
MTDDREKDARRRILERRARFVAAALASTSAACRGNPMVCLEPPPAIQADDAGTKTSTTASTSASTTAAPSASTEPDAMPLECLKIAPPPSHPPPPPSGSGSGGGGAKPKMCLTEMFFDDEEPKG